MVLSRVILSVSWGHLGGYFEAFLGVFWGSWAAPGRDLASGRSRGVSGAAPGRLRGASGAPPGRPLAASGVPSGPKLAPWGRQVGPNMGSRELPTGIPGRHLFREGVGTRKWSPNGTNM